MIKRKLFNDLIDHLKQKEITLLMGPRQAGKTTLLILLKEYLEKRGGKTVFFNLDIETDKYFFTSQTNLLKKIQLEIGKEGTVFIDEIQRKEDAGIFLKGLYDMNLPYKFIISGSGSVELKEKIHESLAGRKRAFILSTISFEEFIQFKTQYRYEGKLANFFEIEKEKTLALLEDYLNFGGYPRIILEDTLEGKKALINEIYQSYIEKDITYLLRIRKTEDFTHLVKLMASQIGNVVNYTEISATLGISQKTVKEYLWYLEKTFILSKITPYFRNARKEITKAPIFYFSDLGLRNYAFGNFGYMRVHTSGFLFQNFIFRELLALIQETPMAIHFWRTKTGGEVDFVVEQGSGVLIPFEIKYTRFKKPEVTRSFRNFIEKYKPKIAYIVNLMLEEELVIGKTKIIFLPFYKISTLQI